MISLHELLQQLALAPSPEERRSLELGVHLASVQATPGDPAAPSRTVGWHLDRLTAALAHGGAEVFFDEFGRHCGKLMLASLDDDAERQFLEDGIATAEMLGHPLGAEAWIVEAAFWYGALRTGRRALRQVLAVRGVETVGYIVYRASAPAVARVWTLDRPRDAASPAASALRAGQLRHEARAWLAERQAIGAALRVLSSSDRFRQLSLDDAMCLLLGPITLGQYAIELTAEGAPIGFRSWAYLTEHATNRLVTQGPRSLSDGCWNQGTQKTLICDGTTGAAPPAWAWAVLPASRYSI